MESQYEVLTADFTDRLEKLKKRIGDKDINIEEFEAEEEKNNLKNDLSQSLHMEFEDKEIQVMLTEVPIMHNMFTNTDEKYRGLPR